MSLIYEPKSDAREYAERALNIYKGCTHGCIYCYNARMPWFGGRNYFNRPNEKENFIERLEIECKKINAASCPEIFMSFVGDLYQPGYNPDLTRDTIKMLKKYKLHFTILTKGGHVAINDFDLLAGYNRCRFGVSISFVDEKLREKYEPNAAPLICRHESLKIAKVSCIKTWVSLEPVINPSEAINVIETMHQHVDAWKIGKINHFKEYDSLNPELWKLWRDHKLIPTLEKCCCNYYLKDSLRSL